MNDTAERPNRAKPELEQEHVSIQSVLDVQEKSAYQRFIGNQSFWVTVALVAICLGDGLADHVGAGVKQRLHGGRVRHRRPMARQPIRIAASGDPAGNIENVLGCEGQALQRTIGRPGNLEIAMRTEGSRRAGGRRQAHVSIPVPSVSVGSSSPSSCGSRRRMMISPLGRTSGAA